MREIKFRFFDGEKMCPVRELTFFEPSGYNINEEFPSTGTDPYPLMQYTGLKDKNGVEIYEGDIIEIERQLTNASKIKPIRQVTDCFSRTNLPTS